MQTLALVSQKGGSGKTTLAIHLLVEAATHGMRTLLLDIDPQGSQLGRSPATGRCGRRRDRGGALRAARLADFILLPTRCSIIDIGTMGATRDICQLARRPAAVVINAAPIRSRVVQETTDAMTALGLLVCDTVIRERVALRHSLIDGRVAREFEPDGNAAAEITALHLETRLRANTRTQETV